MTYPGRWILAWSALSLGPLFAAGEETKAPESNATGTETKAAELLEEARAAARRGRLREALGLATRGIRLEPDGVELHFLRASIHGALENHAAAVEDYSRVIALDPGAAPAYQQRGHAQFKLAKFEKAIADYDRFIELRPAERPRHWQRGIAYYYAGEFLKGQKQFEGYQTVDSSDVENAVWRYLCMARRVGVEKARTALLKIGHDPRVPMKETYALFQGELTPSQVLRAARAGGPSPRELNRRLFYAHLYVGLFFDVAGKRTPARQHMKLAAERYRIGRFMWDVARVHADLLGKGDGTTAEVRQ